MNKNKTQNCIKTFLLSVILFIGMCTIDSCTDEEVKLNPTPQNIAKLTIDGGTIENIVVDDIFVRKLSSNATVQIRFSFVGGPDASSELAVTVNPSEIMGNHALGNNENDIYFRASPTGLRETFGSLNCENSDGAFLHVTSHYPRTFNQMAVISANFEGTICSNDGLREYYVSGEVIDYGFE